MPKGKPKTTATAQPAPQTTEKPQAKATAAKAEAVNGKPKNKMEGVRWALQKMGKEAMPPQIQGWLKDTYKLNMPVSTISNYKSTILNKKSGKKKAKAHSKGGRPAKAAHHTGSSAGGISLDDIRAVKHLADRIGAAKVRELAVVLAK